ncbi:MAG: AraC family transcriptional regulator [Planctomycetota bacterium]
MAILQVETGQLGERLEEVSVAGVRVNRAIYSAHLTTPKHAHRRANLCLPLSGCYEETWGKRSATVDARSVMVKPPGVEHLNRFGPRDVTCLNIELEPEVWDEFAGPAVGAPCKLMEPSLPRMARSLERELAQPDRTAGLAAQGLVLSIVASALRAHERLSSCRPKRWLDEVRDRLEGQFLASPQLADLAASVGVHPAHLTRQFRARFGCSIGDYVRRLRVNAVLQALDHTDRTLAEIALGCGFSDQSHMGRVVRRETGMTPGAWRTRAASARFERSKGRR